MSLQFVENLADPLWAAVSVALLVAGLAKGVTGIGYATTAMPLLTMVAGLEKALALVVVPALVSNAAVFVGANNLGSTFFRFAPLYAGILPGIAAGTVLLPLVDTGLATQGLAALTLAYVVMAVAKPELSIAADLGRRLALPAGMMNGVLTGLTGSQILPLVPYMLALQLDPRTQVVAINLAVTIASLALGAALLVSGGMTNELIAMSCAGAAPAIAGTLIGNVVRDHLRVAAVRRITLAMLVAISLSLAGRPAWDAAVRHLCESESVRAGIPSMVALCPAVLAAVPPAAAPVAPLAERAAAHAADNPVSLSLMPTQKGE